MKRFFGLVASLSLAFAVGCGVAPAEEGDAQGEEQDLTNRNVATLTFASDFSESVQGKLETGKRVRIRYAAERLPECRLTLNGGAPGWTITGFARSNGETRTFWVAGHKSDPSAPAEPVLDLDRPGRLELWFQVTNAKGCSKFDSDFGRNYSFDVTGVALPRAKVRFAANPASAPTVEGKIAAGGRVEIDYAADRLPSCRATAPGGGPAWTITGFASVNGGAAKSFWVAGHSSDPSMPRPVIEVPKPGRLEIWFQVTNRHGCSAFDSNLSRNYAFDVN